MFYEILDLFDEIMDVLRFPDEILDLFNEMFDVSTECSMCCRLLTVHSGFSLNPMDNQSISPIPCCCSFSFADCLLLRMISGDSGYIRYIGNIVPGGWWSRRQDGHHAERDVPPGGAASASYSGPTAPTATTLDFPTNHRQ